MPQNVFFTDQAIIIYGFVYKMYEKNNQLSQYNLALQIKYCLIPTAVTTCIIICYKNILYFYVNNYYANMIAKLLTKNPIKWMK